METKICSNCGQEKPISEFPKCKRNKDGLDTHCKECRNAKNKAYREANKDKVFDLSDPIQQKKCFCYKNLQPLWAIDNLKKAYKYENSKSV